MAAERGDLERWLEAERAGREGEAEAAFREVFAALPRPVAPPAFSARVLEAVAEAAARRARHERRVRAMVALGVAVAGTGLLLAGYRFAGAMALELLVGLLDVAVRGIVWLATALEGGVDAWSLLAQTARAIGAALTRPSTAGALIAIELVGAGALYALYRLLAAEEKESFR
jgi:hypothetical protein